MVRVRVRRSGGFAGVPLVAEIDSSKLSPEQAAEIEKAIDGIDFVAQPAPSRPVPDGFRYEIEVWRDADHARLTAEDPFVPPLVRSLLQLVQRLGGARANG